jgi:carboxyl-terminal processing protease
MIDNHKRLVKILGTFSLSREIKNAIARINEKNIKGWIIDLRINTGGNMYPMIAGLTEFLGEGRVGGFITPTNQPDGLSGEPTGGYTTTNIGFKLNEYSGLNLAVDYASDRNGKVYPKNINPDILVSNGGNFEFLNKDEKVKKAIDWLRKNK